MCKNAKVVNLDAEGWVVSSKAFCARIFEEVGKKIVLNKSSSSQKRVECLLIKDAL